MELVRGRLELGERAYRDESFRRDPMELAGEFEQELLDICGWSFILWCRIRELKREIEHSY